MKFSTASALTLVGAAQAFPNMAKLMQAGSAAQLEKRYTENMEAFGHLEKRAYGGNTGVHQYVAPKAGDYRGPCPGLNAAANHGYLNHNGVTDFAQLVQAQMDVYNVGIDLAILLCTVSIPLDGDIVTTRMSIGGDATALTALGGELQGNTLGRQGGLNTHNTFEADSSLTRNDVFLANGDNYSFNGTLFGMMTQTCQETSGGLYDFACMTKYREQRYYESKANNPNFYFGVKSLLLFGASSFLYTLMPNGNDNIPSYAVVSSFFGAGKNADGTFKSHAAGVGEKIPDNWVPRKTPYTITDVGSEILKQYFGTTPPVAFGGNAGSLGFNALNAGTAIQNGQLNVKTASDLRCLLFQIATDNYPSSLSGGVALLSAAGKAFAVAKLLPYTTVSGCPAVPGQPVLSA
ncbi:Chloroperoxidase [Protomyces lactucae-debilis]|uniref:Chloroperoxidase n=1 Tax=Protomyces lactucae-debilis TaxID=2754530 RepID=A0A1Y2FEX6_PROLT|nr:Chloroperoxidase [Protomyces lactucae-debilis]ORY82462.1 Chloroperoxidase [Protomyces lactucae-debilis]